MNCGKRLQPLADMTGGDHRIKPDPIDPRLGDVPLVEETRAARVRRSSLLPLGAVMI